MTAINSHLGVQGVMALRAHILEQSTTIRQAAGSVPASAPVGPSGPGQKPVAAPGFAAAMDQAVQAVNALQDRSGAEAAAWERGETQDIAGVMLARQKASVAFETTVQVRNRLLGAYRDIMNMPV